MMKAFRVAIFMSVALTASVLFFHPSAARAVACTGTGGGKTVQGECVNPSYCAGPGILALPSPECTGATPVCCGGELASPSAAGETPKSLTELDPLKNMTVYTVVQNIIRTFLGFVGALALLVFVYAGITWMTAGSTDRVKQAKETIKYAVIGLALIVFSYAITMFFFKTLGS